MKRRDLLKGLLGIPAAIVGAKAVQADRKPRLLDVTNLHTPRGKREFICLDDYDPRGWDRCLTECRNSEGEVVLTIEYE